MATNVSYKFSVTAPTLPYEVVSPPQEYTNSEFDLSLPRGWKQAPNGVNHSVQFFSEAGAAINVLAELCQTPDDEQAKVAEFCLDTRARALEELGPGRSEVLRRTIEPHPSGAGLEMVFVAEVDGHTVFSYLGHVTPRKVMSFGLTWQTDRQTAAAFFDKLVQQGYRPKLP